MRFSLKLHFDFVKNFLDLSAICELEQAEFPWPWTSSDWRNLNDSFYLTCAYENDKVLGVSLWEKGPWDDVAHLHKIFVKKEFQGKGIAHQLLEHSANYLQQLGGKSLYLEVAVNNYRAIEFYKKFGFVELVVKKSFYRDGTDAYAMHKELN